MPRRKRALEETDANAQPPAKRSSSGKASEQAPQKPAEISAPTESPRVVEEAPKCQDGCDLEKAKPEEYICIDRPLLDFEAQHRDEDDEYDEDDESAFNAYKEASSGPNRMWPKPAAEHPSWKWTTMVGSWKDLCELRIKQTYVNPGNLDMHVFNDLHAYGLNSMIEEKVSERCLYSEVPSDAILRSSNSTRNIPRRSGHCNICKSSRFSQDSSYVIPYLMYVNRWAIMATLGLWLNFEDALDPWIGIDDGPRMDALVGLLGRAFLCSLDAIHQPDQLKTESDFRDLGLVMSLWLQWSNDLVS